MHNTGFEEHGAVEGRLQSLEPTGDEYQFIVYEPLRNEEIVCTTGDRQVFNQALALSGKRVVVEGLVKHTARGIPYAVTVYELRELPEPPPGIYKKTRGILKKYSG